MSEIAGGVPVWRDGVPCRRTQHRSTRPNLSCRSPATKNKTYQKLRPFAFNPTQPNPTLDKVVEQALAMLVNAMFQSDANRGLAEECGVALPTIAIMDAVQEEGALVQVSSVPVLVPRAEGLAGYT